MIPAITLKFADVFGVEKLLNMEDILSLTATRKVALAVVLCQARETSDMFANTTLKPSTGATGTLRMTEGPGTTTRE
jgi:hypothetical protein